MMRILFSIFMLMNTSVLFAKKLPENHAINGGVTIIPLDINQKPTAYFNNKRVPVIKSDKKNQWLLVVGVPLDNKQNILQLNMTKPTTSTIPFHASTALYKTQYLSIANKRKVEPNPNDLKRIAKEEEKRKTILEKYTDRNPFTENFIAPSNGRLSSQFGLKRVYNKKPRAPHSGLDVATPAGKPVLATASGHVVEAAPYFFTGNTVIIDHGMGVFSLYAHLDKMQVKPGEPIKQGKPVGTIGKTGRVTGPHLHWSMYINQTLVNPLLFVSADKVIKTRLKNAR